MHVARFSSRRALLFALDFFDLRLAMDRLSTTEQIKFMERIL
jgi:hypothetical protein